MKSKPLNRSAAKLPMPRAPLMLLLMLVVLAALTGPCQAQSNPEQSARVVQSLADGSFIVEIAGAQYRAVSNAQLDEQTKTFDHLTNQLTTCKADQKLANDEAIKFGQTVEILKRDVTIAQQDLKLEHANFIRAMTLYDGEHKLRAQAETFIPRGRVNSFFTKPVVVLFEKIGVKGIDWWLSSKRKR